MSARRFAASAAAAIWLAHAAHAGDPPPLAVRPPSMAARADASSRGAAPDPRTPALLAFVQRARTRAAELEVTGATARSERARSERAVADAIARLRERANGAVDVAMDARRRTPRMMRGKLQRATDAGPGATRAERTARVFLREQRALLRIAEPDVELTLVREQHDELGRTHLRFRQRVDGVPVEPAELLVHLDPRGDVEVVNGSWAPTPSVGAPSISAEDAVARARIETPGAIDAAIPDPEWIVWAPGGRPARSAWSVFVPASLTQQWIVVIDATSGEPLTSWNTVMEGDVAGNGTDLLGANRPLHVWQEDGTNYLVDASKPMFDPTSDPPGPQTARGVIAIFDAQNQPPNDNPDDIPDAFQITSAATSEPAATWLPDGVSALANLSSVYDYYRNVHGRDSLDGEGGSIYAVVRIGRDYANAFFSWTLNVMAFGDHDDYAAALDAVAHELTHGVTQHSANLIYRDESGALNESMSDVFGEMVEWHVTGANDWIIGSILREPVRNMADPASMSAYGQPYPTHYSQYRHLGDLDSGGVHINSSIINLAYYQLAVGLSGGIGNGDAERIFYRALTVYLTASSQFIDARLACVQAAADLFGEGSLQQQRVRAAFDFVGIVDGTSTPPEPPFPGTDGDDSTLFLRYDAVIGSYLLYRAEPDLDGNVPSLLSAFDVSSARPAVTGDGSAAWFVDSLNDLCVIATDGSQAQESCAGLPGQVSSVGVSPNGKVYGFVLRDADTGERRNQISVIDLSVQPPGVATYELDAPVTTPGPNGSMSVATVQYADSMDFTADDRMVVYDALNRLEFAGEQLDVWSIYALDRATGDVFAIVPPQPRMDIGFPSLAQRSDDFVVFDAYDVSSATGSVMAANLQTGEVTTVATGLAGYGVPGYNGDDTRVIYSDGADNDTGFSLFAQAVADRVAPQGAPTAWASDADFGAVYRRGTFVPEPSASALALFAVAALAALARVQGGARGARGIDHLHVLTRARAGVRDARRRKT